MRVLHLLSQRPSLTGSGVTLDAVVRHAAAAGWEQRVVVGVPAGEPEPRIGDLDSGLVHPLPFGTDDLPFPVPGMSDVMPYPSTVFSTMSDGEIAAYLEAWQRHIATVVEAFEPDLVHSHHVWLMSSLVKDLAPSLPVVTQCHATGLRQLALAPHLARRVRDGCAQNDAFLVLHRGHSEELRRAIGVAEDRVHVVGAGYRDDLFHRRGRDPNQTPALLYVGKFSDSKGLPWLLDAFDRLATSRTELVLHVAGDGSGPQAEALRRRMGRSAPRVMLHGQLGQAALADLMRRSTVCVLPSFFEGLPLVLVEALACGCRLVATDLPGVADELAPRLGSALELVDLPPMVDVDTPLETALPAFVDRLESGLRRALDAPGLVDQSAALEAFTWAEVFSRIEKVWCRVLR